MGESRSDVGSETRTTRVAAKMDTGGVSSLALDHVVDEVAYEGDIVHSAGIGPNAGLTGHGNTRDVPGSGRWKGLGDGKRDSALRCDDDRLGREGLCIGYAEMVFRGDAAAMEVDHDGE